MPAGISARLAGPDEISGRIHADRRLPALFLLGFGRAACVSENRSGSLSPRDNDGSLVPPGDTGLSRSGGPARASPTQSRTAAPPSGRPHPPAGDLPTQSLRERSFRRYQPSGYNRLGICRATSGVRRIEVTIPTYRPRSPRVRRNVGDHRANAPGVQSPACRGSLLACRADTRRRGDPSCARGFFMSNQQL
jgi:hypothetical protein